MAVWTDFRATGDPGRVLEASKGTFSKAIPWPSTKKSPSYWGITVRERKDAKKAPSNLSSLRLHNPRGREHHSISSSGNGLASYDGLENENSRTKTPSDRGRRTRCVPQRRRGTKSCCTNEQRRQNMPDQIFSVLLFTHFCCFLCLK